MTEHIRALRRYYGWMRRDGNRPMRAAIKAIRLRCGATVHFDGSYGAFE